MTHATGCPYKYFVKINLSFIVLTHVTVFCCQFDAQMQKRLEQMKKGLEQQQRELDEKRRNFDKEKEAWDENMRHKDEQRKALEGSK